MKMAVQIAAPAAQDFFQNQAAVVMQVDRAAADESGKSFAETIKALKTEGKWIAPQEGRDAQVRDAAAYDALAILRGDLGEVKPQYAVSAENDEAPETDGDDADDENLKNEGEEEAVAPPLDVSIEEDVSRLMSPTADNSWHPDDFAESLELFFSGGLSGTVKAEPIPRVNFTPASGAVVKASRFNPDLILEDEITDGYFHGNIHEFTDKYRGARALADTGSSGEDAAADDAAPAASIDVPDDYEGASEPGAVLDVPQLADADEAESPDVLEDGTGGNRTERASQFAEKLAGYAVENAYAINNTAAEPAVDVSEAAEADNGSERAAQFAEKLAGYAGENAYAINNTAAEPAVDVSEAAEADNGSGGAASDIPREELPSAEAETPDRADDGEAGNGAAGRQERGDAGDNERNFGQKEAAVSDSLPKKAAASAGKPQRQDPVKADAADNSPAQRTSLFANEMASALRSEAAKAFESPERTYDAARPGMIYELDGGDALGDGLRSVIQFMKNDGVNEARIVVEPPSLGRVDVSLQSGANGVEAVFKVDNDALKQMLQQHLDALKESLQAQGIHVSNLAVDIKYKDERSRGDVYGARGKTRRAGRAESGDGEVDSGEITRLARIDLEKGLLHWVA
jgi:hypothetical protein